MKVGFVGTGSMGRPMLRNLVAKGFSVVAYDVQPAALEAAVKLGARPAASTAAAASESDTSAAQQVLRMASSQGYGKKDVASVYAFLKASSGDAPV